MSYGYTKGRNSSAFTAARPRLSLERSFGKKFNTRRWGLDPLKAGDDGILSRIDPLKGTEIWRARPLDGERFSAIIVSEDHHYGFKSLVFQALPGLLDAATGIPLSRPINVTVFCSDAKYAELINVSSASVGIQCGRTVAIRKAAKLSWQLQTKEPQLGDYMIFPGATLP